MVVCPTTRTYILLSQSNPSGSVEPLLKKAKWHDMQQRCVILTVLATAASAAVVELAAVI